MTTMLVTLSPQLCAALQAQTRIPTPVALISHLIRAAVLIRGATSLHLSFQGHSLQCVDNGRPLTVEELRMDWKDIVLGKVAEVVIMSWGSPQHPMQMLRLGKDGWMGYTEIRPQDDMVVRFPAMAGTNIEISSLFHGLPVRLNHAQTVTAIRGDVVSLLRSFALAYPHCNVVFDGYIPMPRPSLTDTHTTLKTWWDFPHTQSCRQAFKYLYPGQSNDLRDICLDEGGGVVVRGLISSRTSQFVRTREMQHVFSTVSPDFESDFSTALDAFVVHQFVQEKTWSKSYVRRHPVFILRITSRDDIPPTSTPTLIRNIAHLIIQDDIDKAIHSSSHHAQKKTRVTITPSSSSNKKPSSSARKFFSPRDHVTTIQATLSTSSLSTCSFIGRLNNEFILALTESKTLVCFDQHAAHERVRLETKIRKVCNQAQLGDLKTWQIAPAGRKEYVIDTVTNDELTRLNTFRNHLARWGFEFQVVNTTSVQVTQVPVIENYPLLAEDALSYAFDLSLLPPHDNDMVTSTTYMPKSIQRVLASKACRGAVMFGDELDDEFCIWLIRQLAVSCTFPFICAHGRPSVVPLCL